MVVVVSGAAGGGEAGQLMEAGEVEEMEGCGWEMDAHREQNMTD